MKVINKSKSIVLSENVEIRTSFLGRALGLMLSEKRDIILDSRFEDVTAAGIHTLFMKYPIEVAWLDNEMTVVDLNKKVEPFNPVKKSTWRIYRPKRPARYVVELGLGKLGTTEVGDEIKIQ